MTAHSQSTKRKLSLLQLAQELGNVSKACKIMGYHRDTLLRQWLASGSRGGRSIPTVAEPCSRPSIDRGSSRALRLPIPGVPLRRSALFTIDRGR